LIGAILFSVIGLIGAVQSVMILAHLRANLFTASALLLFTGAAVAGIFVVCSSSAGLVREQRAASEIYAADLAGGCLGAVAGSLWLVPFVGMLPTAALMIGLSLAGVILMKS
jgi:hypothetical protein